MQKPKKVRKRSRSESLPEPVSTPGTALSSSSGSAFRPNLSKPTPTSPPDSPTKGNTYYASPPFTYIPGYTNYLPCKQNLSLMVMPHLLPPKLLHFQCEYSLNKLNKKIWP